MNIIVNKLIEFFYIYIPLEKSNHQSYESYNQNILLPWIFTQFQLIVCAAMLRTVGEKWREIEQ